MTKGVYMPMYARAPITPITVPPPVRLILRYCCFQLMQNNPPARFHAELGVIHASFSPLILAVIRVEIRHTAISEVLDVQPVSRESDAARLILTNHQIWEHIRFPFCGPYTEI